MFFEEYFMSKVCVQFSDESKDKIISVFAGKQDETTYPNQGEVDTEDDSYKAFVASVASVSPEIAKFLPVWIYRLLTYQKWVLSTDGVDLKTASGRYNFRNILSAAQYESDLNSERTLAGLAVAITKGRTDGRRPKFTAEQWDEMSALLESGVSRVQVSEQFGVAVSTLYKKFPV